MRRLIPRLDAMRRDDRPVPPEAAHPLVVEALDGFFGRPVEPRAQAALAARAAAKRRCDGPGQPRSSAITTPLRFGRRANSPSGSRQTIGLATPAMRDACADPRCRPARCSRSSRPRRDSARRRGTGPSLRRPAAGRAADPRCAAPPRSSRRSLQTRSARVRQSRSRHPAGSTLRSGPCPGRRCCHSTVPSLPLISFLKSSTTQASPSQNTSMRSLPSPVFGPSEV